MIICSVDEGVGEKAFHALLMGVQFGKPIALPLEGTLAILTKLSVRIFAWLVAYLEIFPTQILSLNYAEHKAI